MTEKESKIIIKYDDYAGHEPTNKGITSLIERGIGTDVSIISQFVREQERNLLLQAVDRSPLNRNPGIGMVLHVNTVTGRPISNPKDVPSMVDAHGKFLKPKGITLSAWEEYAKRLVPDEVRREINNQVDAFFKVFGHYPHALDSHNMILASPPADEIAEEIAMQLGICLTAPKQFATELHPVGGPFPEKFEINEKLWERRKRLGIKGADNADTEYYNRYSELQEGVSRLTRALSSLQPGITEFFFHPGHPDLVDKVDDPRFRTGRVRDFEILTNESVLSVLQSIPLVSYKKLFTLDKPANPGTSLSKKVCL